MHVEELAAVLTAKRQRATVDGDDLRAAGDRARRELAATLALVAACRQRHFPAAHIKLVEALVEPDQAAVNAVDSTVKAMTDYVTHLKRAVAMADEHLRMQADGAAGQVYRTGAAAPAGDLGKAEELEARDVEDGELPPPMTPLDEAHKTVADYANASPGFRRRVFSSLAGGQTDRGAAEVYRQAARVAGEEADRSLADGFVDLVASRDWAGNPPPRRVDAPDPLRVADRIVLNAGEQFAGSGSTRDGQGVTVLAAAVDTSSGRQVHLGVPIREEDRRNWRGAHASPQDAQIDEEDGGEYRVETGAGTTVVLDAATAAKLPDQVDAVVARAAKVDQECRRARKECARLYEKRVRLEEAQRPGSKTAGGELELVIAELDEANRKYDGMAGWPSATVEIPALNGGALVIEAVQREGEDGVDYRVDRKPADAAADWGTGDIGDPYFTTAAGLRKVAKLAAGLAGG